MAHPSAPPAAFPEQASSPAVRAPSTPRAPPLALSPAQARREPPELAPDLERAPDLDHLAPAALPALVASRQPASPRARSAPLPEAVADVRSIQKPRKAR